jgi:beta-lactamase class D
MAPDSTFKIALSLMAFDAEIIDQKTIEKQRYNECNGYYFFH